LRLFLCIFIIGGAIIKKDKYKNIKDWFPIKKVNDNKIYTKDGKKVEIFKVQPINFKLKSNSEKNIILSAYKQFLKICNFDMQIIIQTDSINMDNHFIPPEILLFYLFYSFNIRFA
jgi:hypothetical protein